jgi:hypothetical protein
MNYSGVEFVIDESDLISEMVFCYVSQEGLDVAGYTQEELEEEIVLGEMGYELSPIAELVQSYNEHGLAALFVDPGRLNSFLENADPKTIEARYGPEWEEDITEAVFHIVNYFEVDWENQRDILKKLGGLVSQTTVFEIRPEDGGNMTIEEGAEMPGSLVEGKCRASLQIGGKEAVSWNEWYYGKYEGDFVNDSVEWSSGLDDETTFKELDEQRNLKALLNGITGGYKGSCELEEPWVYQGWEYSPLEGQHDGRWAVSIAEPFEIFFAYYNSEEAARAALDYIDRFIVNPRSGSWVRYVLRAKKTNPSPPVFEIDDDFDYMDPGKIFMVSPDWEIVSKTRKITRHKSAGGAKLSSKSFWVEVD